jgi:hypothetical protein
MKNSLKIMNEFMELVSAFLELVQESLKLIFVVFFAGTMLWLLWPVTAVGVFHAPSLTWWQSVVGMWTLNLIGSCFRNKSESKNK